MNKERMNLNKIAEDNNGKEEWLLTHIYDTNKKQILQTIAYTQALKDIYADSQPIIGNMIIILSYDRLNNLVECYEY
ncbi:hypothetical protein HQN89_28100 [Paenibacillus frigoriresistens]|uniref:hypothetical protein n=1 Tax=Paenibacillus alginolyticus TaxID=59839 RepID=UPI00156461FA|nr:hypothetical protein [Paenibacillus frigoriresistens]NRF94762.1 hypothetical protein [Paenibacillus frigoriresistens]